MSFLGQVLSFSSSDICRTLFGISMRSVIFLTFLWQWLCCITYARISVRTTKIDNFQIGGRITNSFILNQVADWSNKI